MRIKISIRLSTYALAISLMILTGCSSSDWRTASREPAGIAPSPETTPEAVVQVYAADVFGWRGLFAVHTWIAAKPTNAQSYTVYEVVGWRTRQGLPALSIREDAPDRYWFGAEPELLLDRRGPEVESIIQAVDQAARSYPWANEYKLFPGPNSNTFPAWIAEQVPELELELPLRAIGSGWREG